MFTRKNAVLFILITLALSVVLAGCSKGNIERENTISESNFSNNADEDTAPGSNSYRLSGGNEFILISDGYIAFTKNKEQFYGGTLSFSGEEPAGLKDFSFEFYFDFNGDKIIFNKSAFYIQGSEKGMSIATDLGSTEAETLFNQEAWESLIDSLRFTVRGTFLNGDSFEYDVPITIWESTLPNL